VRQYASVAFTKPRQSSSATRSASSSRQHNELAAAEADEGLAIVQQDDGLAVVGKAHCYRSAWAPEKSRTACSKLHHRDESKQDDSE
jgi:hypothetical protein